MEEILKRQWIPYSPRFCLEDPPSREELEAVMAMLDDAAGIARPGVTFS